MCWCGIRRIWLAVLSCCLLTAPLFAQVFPDDEKPQTNVFAIVKTNDGALQVIPAKEAYKKDPNLYLTNMEDRKLTLRLEMLIDLLPYYLPEDTQLSDDAVQRIVQQYDNLIKIYPELLSKLQQDQQRFKSLIEERQRAMAMALLQFTAEPFNEAADYQRAALEEKIQTGEDLVLKYPAIGVAVNTYLQPWQQRLTALKEGRVRFEGKWLTKAEIQELLQQRQDAQIQQFAADLQPVNLSNTVISAPVFGIGMFLFLASMLFVLVCVLYVLFGTNRKGVMEWGILTASVFILGLYGFYGIRFLREPGTIEDYVSTKKMATMFSAVLPEDLVKILYFSHGGERWRELQQDYSEIRLDSASINAAIDRLITFKEDTPPGSFGIGMSKVQFYMQPGKLCFLQQVTCWGKNILLRYDLHFNSNNNIIKFYRCDVYIGDTALPGLIGSCLWSEFYRDIREVIRTFNVSHNYQIQKIENDKLVVEHTASET